MKSYQRQLPHLSDLPEPMPALSADIPNHQPPSGLSPIQIYLIVRHYWRQSVVIAAVLMVVSAVIIKLLPKSYTATTTLIVNTARENPLPEQQYGGNDLPDYVATQAELITSPAVLTPVVDRLKLTSDPNFTDGLDGNTPLARDMAERTLASSVNVDQGRGGQLLQISVSSGNPVQAANIANAIGYVYLQEDRARANDPVSQQAQLSSEELSQLRDKVTDAQTKVTAFRQQYGLTSLTGGDTDTEMQSLNSLQTRLLEVQNQRRALEAQQVGAIDSGDEALASARVTALREQLATLQARLAELRPTLGPKHPEVLGLEAQIRATDRSLGSTLDNLSSNVATQLMRSRQLESELTQAVAAQRVKVLDLRKIQDQGAKLQLELQSSQTVYKQALDGYDQLKFNTAQNFANVSLVSLASPPVRPSKPKKMELLGLAIVASIAAGILVPFLYELWIDRRVRCRDDLERGLGVRVLAELDPVPY